jgi:hypothetical protein
MKVHFGIIIDEGDYEHPLSTCEETLCGCTGEEPCMNAVEEWQMVTCKKCLKLKQKYELGVKIDEEAIVNQMGEMADFYVKERAANNYD